MCITFITSFFIIYVLFLLWNLLLCYLMETSFLCAWHFHVISSHCCSCRWGETMNLNCSHQQAYCSSPRWYMSMVNQDKWCWQDKTEELEEKPVPMPLCTPHISHGLAWAWTRASVARVMTNCLSYGMAFFLHNPVSYFISVYDISSFFILHALHHSSHDISHSLFFVMKYLFPVHDFFFV
jgi:hypothetical protein